MGEKGVALTKKAWRLSWIIDRFEIEREAGTFNQHYDFYQV